MRILVSALAATCLSTQVWATDFGAGGVKTGRSENGACSWSRPHIVFQNNTKADIVYIVQHKAGGWRLYLPAGKEMKSMIKESDVITAPNGDKLTFGKCDKHGSYPAYRWTWNKDDTIEIHEKKKELRRETFQWPK